LPSITHENNTTTLRRLDRHLTILTGARTFSQATSSDIRHACRFPSFR
jgi:hypothetical protein